jgi:hypothetical protein
VLGKIENLIEDLTNLGAGLKPWERAFVEKVSGLLESNIVLTDKQIAKTQEIWEERWLDGDNPNEPAERF